MEVLVTPIKVGQRKGYFINSINGGGEKMYTADQICNMIDVLVDNIFVKMGGVYFVRLLESLWEQVALHCSLICFFTRMKVNFSTVWLKVATGDLLGQLVFVTGI